MPNAQQLAAFANQLAAMLNGDGFHNVMKASMRFRDDYQEGRTCEVCGFLIETDRLEFRLNSDPSTWHRVHLNRPWCRQLKNNPPSPDPDESDGAWFIRLERLYRNSSL